MKKLSFVKPFIFTLFVLALLSCSQSQEEHVQPIVQKILKTKSAIDNYVKPNNATKIMYISAWDFDGTILKGDCSEGYIENGKQVYKGLAEIAIENGLSKIYKRNEFKKFFDYYMHLDYTKGHYESYTYLATIFAGTKEQDLLALSSKYFDTTLHHYYFASSIAIIEELKKHNIHIFIISASPVFFVKGAAKSLSIPENNIYGITLITKNGMLTNKVIQPVTYAQGKTHTLLSILKLLKEQYATEHVYVIAGFGNSYHTDGHFLHYIATQKLPAGKPIAVMINGGTPLQEYKGIFHCVTQTAVVGKRDSSRLRPSE